jgi:hypothetical protein
MNLSSAWTLVWFDSLNKESDVEYVALFKLIL